MSKRCTSKTQLGFVCKNNRINGTDYCRIHKINNDNCCAICLDQPSDPVRLDLCTHVFCKGCISQAIVLKPVCPMCRTMLSISDFAKGVYYIHGAEVFDMFNKQHGHRYIQVPKSYRPKNLPSTDASRINFRF